MMNANKKINKSKQNKLLFKRFNLHMSTNIVKKILSQMIIQLNKTIVINQSQKYIRDNLSKYAYTYHLINLEDHFHSVYVNRPTQTSFKKDQEPIPIPNDSLSHTTLEKPQPKQLSLLGKQSRISSLSKITSNDSKFESNKVNNRSKSLKLKLQPIEQLKIYQDLRMQKINEEKQNKINLEKQLSQKKKQKINGVKIQNISFDYNGAKIPKYDKIQSNLVQKLLELKLKNQKIVKKPEAPSTERVSPFKKEKYQKKKKQQEPSEFTQFLDSHSLSQNIEIKRGIRYNRNSLVIEQKKPIISPLQLKNSMGKRRISKSDFSKINEIVVKKRQARYKKVKTQQVTQQSFKVKRAYSQTNLNNSRHRKRETINIYNPQLRDSMLIRLSDYQPYLVIQRQLPLEDEINNLAKDVNEDDCLSYGSLPKNDDSISRLTEADSRYLRLPSIKPVISSRLLNEDDLIIGKLQNQLRNKQEY